jgi:hypothetical protein
VLTVWAVSMIFFRAADVATAGVFITAMVSGTSSVMPLTPLAYSVLGLSVVVIYAPRDSVGWLVRAYVRLPSIGQAGLVTTCLLLFVAIGGNTAPFIYFQF